MADQLWQPDGTQPLSPMDSWDDPTAGLITGFSYDPEPPIKVEVKTPEMPDISEALAAVLSDDVPSEGKSSGTTGQPVPRKPTRQGLAPELSDTTPGMVAPNVRPGRPRIQVRQLTGLRARSRDEPPPPRPEGSRKAQSSSLAIGVLIGLIVVVVVITIVMISSFLSMISNITN